MVRQIGSLALIALTLLACGCKKSGLPVEATYPVSGTVTLDGNPLPDGNIQFLTKDTGALDIIEIKNGKFEGKAKAGVKTVQINAYKEGPPVEPMPGEKPEPSKINYIPAAYNTESTLTAEVKADGPNQFTFELKSEGGAAAPAP